MIRKYLLIFVILFFVFTPIFCRSAHAQAVTVIHSFGDGSVPNDGVGPQDMIRGSDGNFYGTTSSEGLNDNGTIFKMTPSGTVTILNSSLNASSNLNITQGADGNIYGVSGDGGSTISIDPRHAGYGTMFKLTPSGALTILHNFGDGSVANDGEVPESAPVQDGDGNFYGVTGGGGSGANGTVYKITPTGTETILHNFQHGNVNSDGAGPDGFILGSDGNFYGTTISGGTAGYGTVFKITPTGTITILYTFPATMDYGSYYPTLTQASDGNFYGTTAQEGSFDAGTVFKITPGGTFTTLYTFTGGNDGGMPEGPLIQAPDGDLYGTTYSSGSLGYGTIFRITTTGALTTLVTFTGSNDGGGPLTALISVGNGIFYGTTVAGGTAQVGTAFFFDLAAVPLTITGLSRTVADAGDPSFTLTITGTGFNSTTLVTFGGTVLPITTRTETQLTVTVPASAFTTVGPHPVIVNNPGIATLPFTVVYPWSARDIAAVPDGTTRVLWTRADGAAGIWSMNAADAQTAVGPTYGPYTGWTAQDVAAASDGTSRILWNRYDGATGVWAMNAAGVQTSVGPTYGPFSGWKAIDLATAPNGTSRLMWRYTNGQAGLLSLSATGTQVISGRSYGPYSGWTATAVGAAGDGTARILWTRSDGAMGIWTMDAGDLQLSVGPTYGPYSDSHGHWTATDLSTSADGSSQVLWKRSDGAIGVWSFSASNVQTLVGPVYGPYAGWAAAALDAASDKARMLWVRSDRVAGVWSFGSNDAESLIGPVYGPY